MMDFDSSLGQDSPLHMSDLQSPDNSSTLRNNDTIKLPHKLEPLQPLVKKKRRTRRTKRTTSNVDTHGGITYIYIYIYIYISQLFTISFLKKKRATFRHLFMCLHQLGHKSETMQ